MVILGIESSCDETAASVVKDGKEILSNIVASSAEMHIKTGGIIPERAAREQVKSIIPVIDGALKTGVSWNNEKSAPNIDAVAVTVGPGLIGSLLVGVETAKTLSYLWRKPLIPVNHLVGHVYANWLSDKNNSLAYEPKLPALVLVVSGGHTDLVLIESHGNIKWIGGTRDDAAGEAFDKTARLLKLPYPGGPSISAEAEKFSKDNPNAKLSLFPRPLISENNFDWSFSGLKTAVLREVESTNPKDLSVPMLSAEIQEAIVDVLVEKSQRAIDKYKPKSFLLAGGVAANKRLTEKFVSVNKTRNTTGFHVPTPKLCTDNAAYIASCAYFNNHPVNWQKVSVNPQLTITGEN